MRRLRTPRRPARVRRLWLWALVGLGLLVAAAPTLVGYTSIPASLMAGAIPAEAGRLTARGTSVAWTGPTVVSGVELSDPEGNVLFSAERVELAGGVMTLLAGDSAPLRVRVDRPKADLVLTAGGTNFDRLIAALEKKEQAEASVDGPAGGPTARRPLDVTVEDAAVRVSQTTTGAQWLAEGVQVELRDPGLGVDAIELQATGKLSAMSEESTSGEFEVRLGAGEQGGRIGRIHIDSAPLALVEPFLRRADPTAAVSGLVDVQGEAVWKPGAVVTGANSPADTLNALIAGGVRSSGAVRLTEVGFRGRATEGGPIRLATIDAPWRMASDGQALVVQQLDLQSEVGAATVAGSVIPAEVDGWIRGLATAPRDLRLDGRIDLGRLATVAPQWLHLQKGARIDSGRIKFNVDSTAGRVVAKLGSGALAGVAKGKAIEWREPIDLQLAATQRDPAAGLAGWSLQNLRAESSFFHANASGDWAQLDGNADFDLDRLASELAPLIDLGATRLAGTGRTQFTLSRDDSQRAWRVSGSGRVEGLLVGPADAPLAREPSLRFKAALGGSLDEPTATPGGQVELTAGDDRLLVTLPDAQAATAQPFDLELSGDLLRWYRRAAVVRSDLPAAESIGLSGQVEASASGLIGAGGGRIDRSKVTLTKFNVDTESLTSAPRVRLLDERIEASGKATWNTETLVVQVSEGQLVSSVLAAGLRDILLDAGDPSASRGEVAYRVDLGRLNAWTPSRGKPAQYAAAGEIEGTLRLRGVPEGLNVRGNAIGKRLTLLDRFPPQAAGQPVARPVAVWSEPELRVNAEAMVLPVADSTGQTTTYTVDVRDAVVKSASVSGSFGGRIEDVVAMRGVRLGGGVDYDLEKLTPMLWPRVGDGVRLVGRDRATFRVETDDQAPADAPASTRFRATVAAPWESADLFGLPVGPGRLSGTLDRGVVRVDPLDVAIGGGRLTATAAATLDPPPAVFTLRPGPLLTDVSMSREVSERVLKYMAPILADAARVEGGFSLDLRELAVPLDPPTPGAAPAGRAAGTLNVQRVRVTPGPTTAEWVTLVRQLEALARDGVESVVQPRETVLVAIDNAAVEFQMVDGRVFHRGLDFYVGDALVRSSGSVGVADETLDLVLTVPILDKWIDRRPQYLGRLRGQALRVPIQGTFSRPKVNRDAFKQLSRQLLESAGAGLIEGLLRKALE